jgi:hypothetical protein
VVTAKATAVARATITDVFDCCMVGWKAWKG